MIDQDVEVFLEHFGIKGQKWGVRKQRTESTPEEAAAKKARNKKILISVGVGLIAAGTIFIASRHIKTKNLSKKTIDSGKNAVKKQLFSNGKTKVNTVRDAQNKQIESYYQRQLKVDPEYAKMTPEKLLAKHNASKDEFDRWLTLRERDQGYKYKGPK
jgi:hypothetical protein